MDKIIIAMGKNKKLLNTMDYTKMYTSIILTLFGNPIIYAFFNSNNEHRTNVEWILISLLISVTLIQFFELIFYILMATRKAIYSKTFFCIESKIYYLWRSKVKIIKRTKIEDMYYKYTFTKYYFFAAWILFLNSIITFSGALSTLIYAWIDTRNNGVDNTKALPLVSLATTIINILSIIYNKVLSRKTNNVITYVLTLKNTSLK